MILLNLNLQHTTIEDFAEHAHLTLANGFLLMESNEDTLICLAQHTQFIGTDPSVPLIELHAGRMLPTQHYFDVKYIHQLRVKEYLSLRVIRYRTDQLSVILYLELDQPDPDRDAGTFAKKALLAWLAPRWGDAVTELPLEDAPSIQKVPMTGAGYPMLDANKWLIEQYFEGGNKSLPKLQKEWMKRREVAEVPLPQNPLDSMKKVIKSEQDRRGPESRNKKGTN